MSDLSIYYWIKNNQCGITTLRRTYNNQTATHTYWARIVVNKVAKFIRINRDEYDTINNRHGAVKDCFLTYTHRNVTRHEHCVRFA